MIRSQWLQENSPRGKKKKNPVRNAETRRQILASPCLSICPGCECQSFFDFHSLKSLSLFHKRKRGKKGAALLHNHCLLYNTVVSQIRVIRRAGNCGIIDQILATWAVLLTITVILMIADPPLDRLALVQVTA